MITKFNKFNEMLTSQDMKNNLNLNIEKGDAANPQQPNNQKDNGMQKNANIKITDIQNRINQINQEKSLINKDIINLQGTQRDLAPNNPNDPQNAQKLKIFTEDQKEKINIQQQKLKLLDDEIKNLQSEIVRHRQNYM